MHYDFIAIPDADVPQAVEPIFRHVIQTYASEANKTVSVWRAVPDDLLDFKPHEKTNPIRTILVHQFLSDCCVESWTPIMIQVGTSESKS